MIGLASEHDAVETVERPENRLRLAQTAIDDHWQIRKGALQLTHHIVSQWGNLPVVLRRQSAEHRFTCMNNHRVAAGFAHRAHKTVQRSSFLVIEAATGVNSRPAPALDNSNPHLDCHGYANGCT